MLGDSRTAAHAKWLMKAISALWQSEIGATPYPFILLLLLLLLLSSLKVAAQQSARTQAV